jgi:hypothetical protein
MKASIDSRGQVKESSIDERYRLLLLSRYLQNVKEVPVASGGSKWVFSCPFCSSLGRTEAKRNERKGALLWNDLQNSWVFYCAKKGSPQCSGGGMTLEKFLSALDDDLAEQYRIDRWQSGTTGKGHNCGAPKGIVEISSQSELPQHKGSRWETARTLKQR